MLSPAAMQTTFGIDYPSPQALSALKAKQEQLEKQRHDTQVSAGDTTALQHRLSQPVTSLLSCPIKEDIARKLDITQHATHCRHPLHAPKNSTGMPALCRLR